MLTDEVVQGEFERIAFNKTVRKWCKKGRDEAREKHPDWWLEILRLGAPKRVAIHWAARQSDVFFEYSGLSNMVSGQIDVWIDSRMPIEDLRALLAHEVAHFIAIAIPGKWRWLKHYGKFRVAYSQVVELIYGVSIPPKELLYGDRGKWSESDTRRVARALRVGMDGVSLPVVEDCKRMEVIGHDQG